MATKSYAPAMLIIGYDQNGNEISYKQSPDYCVQSVSDEHTYGEWGEFFNAKSERYVSADFFYRHIIDLIIQVRFGNMVVSRAEWDALGQPYRMSQDELRELDQPDTVSFCEGEVVYKSNLPASVDDIPF